jgi:hypothetical protein
VDGVAGFPALAFPRAGDYTIRATTAGGLVSAVTAPFTISPGPLFGLGFVVQPGDAFAGATISPAVEVALQDRWGNTIDASAPSIKLTLMGGDHTAVLSGGAAVAPVHGVATFAGLSVDKGGEGYVLVAANPGLATGYSAPFAISLD